MVEFRFTGRGRRRSPEPRDFTWCIVEDHPAPSPQDRERIRAEDEDIAKRRAKFGLY